ncbi:FAD-linked oxidase C-terminal domain-containing protein [Pelagicoccus sp. SDUM812002]|uniref:FAD-binding oxidoreductase n=1 Tax=Pelagicoccus sp. SDUM812002 TaxID=3041266 RepID=UPI00281039C8|nr:FAD-linked oxidase C-terminal domain-containing protein [Pelagicoccus sp. SDUM812002]MDQ8185381.1 FAD-linked oxidase C-terminal domain-containing protein [Pelagicoccus sp. SDUM812002]
MRDQLEKLLRPEQILTEREDLIPYGFDGTAMLKEKAIAVVFPETVQEVASLVKFAKAHKTPIVTRGSGTGLSGGSIPVANGIVVCLVRMDRILEVDTRNLTLMAEAGVLTQAIDDAAAAEGLIYPPDPGSMKISTIGGNVANNSGGLRGLKYGVTRNYVMGMEVVLPDGETAWLGNKCVKDVAGYSLKDLFIGSEGTLGIVTKVLLRLLPRPQARKTLLATFNDIEQAAQTVSDIIAAKIIPCTLEFLDQTTIRCVEDFAKIGLPIEAKALLLMESDGPLSVVTEETRRMQEIAEKNHAISLRLAANNEEAVQLATARRSAFSALARIRPTTILEDVTVPRSELASTVRFIESVAQKHHLTIANFGHMGDGNLHPTFLTNERDVEEVERVELAMVEIFEYTIAVGGTITGEHGVGLAKKAQLTAQFADASYPLLQSIKRSIDPDNLLNPGKLFDV